MCLNAIQKKKSVKDDLKASFSSFLLTVAFSKNHGYQGQIMDWKQSTVIIRWCVQLNAWELLQDINGSRRLQFAPVVVGASVEKNVYMVQLLYCDVKTDFFERLFLT